MPASSLQGMRVLVVEDDFITAEDLQAEFESLGAKVLGPVSNLKDALDLLAEGPAPQAAVLDINLGGEMVYPLADMLRDRRIPFVFATGYEESAIPQPYAGLPRLEKPVSVSSIVQALIR